ncbi:MAG: type II secretion system protein N [Colwellia sp.]
MKKTFTLGAFFLITYLGFLIATMPATFLLGQVKLPQNITLIGVQGTVWHTQIEQITYDKSSIAKVDASLSFWSLFTLTPKLNIHFGDPFISGPEGNLVLTVSSQKAEVTELNVLIKANEIAQQLTLPLPVSAQGNVEISITKLAINLQNKNACLAGDGDITWSKAGVIALDQKIKLGKFNADIACEKNDFALTLSPKNNLGLTFTAYIHSNGRISGNGFLQPNAKFPQQLKSALSFLGKKDSRGRYRLSF